jgi:hypothetical protein
VLHNHKPNHKVKVQGCSQDPRINLPSMKHETKGRMDSLVCHDSHTPVALGWTQPKKT